MDDERNVFVGRRSGGRSVTSERVRNVIKDDERAKGLKSDPHSH
jgi:hypothetical protein